MTDIAEAIDFLSAWFRGDDFADEDTLNEAFDTVMSAARLAADLPPEAVVKEGEYVEILTDSPWAGVDLMTEGDRIYAYNGLTRRVDVTESYQKWYDSQPKFRQRTYTWPVPPTTP